MHLCQHLIRVSLLRRVDLIKFNHNLHLCCVRSFPRQIRNRPDLFQQQQNAAMISPSHNNELKLSSSNDSEELNPVVLKCREILASLPEKKIDGSDDVEYVFCTNFGQVRFDTDNMPPESEDDHRFLKQSLMKPSNLNEIDKQYFNDTESEHNSSNSLYDANILPNGHKLGKLNEIDDQYFGGVNYNQSSLNKDKNVIVPCESLEVEKTSCDPVLPKDAQESHVHKTHLDAYCPPYKHDLNSETDLNYVDEAFFKDTNVSGHEGLNYIEPGSDSLSQSSWKRDLSEECAAAVDSKLLTDFERSLIDEDDEQCTFTPDPRHELTDRSAKMAQVLVDTYKQVTTKVKSVDSPINNKGDIVLTNHEAQKISSRETVVVSASKDKLFNSQHGKEDGLNETSDSALGYVLELRKKKKRESLQEEAEDGSVFVPKYRQVIASVRNLEHLTQKEMTSMLKESIIYDQHGVIALFKPYGMRVHGGGDSGGRQHTHTLQDILPHLCRVMDIDHLHHVHRLDVTTTGVLLLARTKEVAIRLRKMFQEHKVVKNYLAITKGAPSILQGVIDIPLKEGTLDGKHRMVLRPPREGGNKRKNTGFRAVSKFKVLSRLDSAALIYVQPLTGVKHQIRAHLGLGLSCPILADHKYSSLDKIVPQRLNSDVLHKLEMRQARVRDLPMMLHSSSIFLPQFIDHKNLKISCPPPLHFTKTMKALKLNSRKNVTEARTLDFVDLGTEIL